MGFRFTMGEVERIERSVEYLKQIPLEIKKLIIETEAPYKTDIVDVNACYRFCCKDPERCWVPFTLGWKNERGRFVWCPHCPPSVALKIHEKEGAVPSDVIEKIKGAISRSVETIEEGKNPSSIAEELVDEYLKDDIDVYYDL